MMQDVKIITLENMPGIAVIYNPDLIEKMGLSKSIMEDICQQGKLSSIMPFIIHDLLLPLLINQEGVDYYEWFPAALLFGEIPPGKILPILQLVHDKSELEKRNSYTCIMEDKTVLEYISNYANEYIPVHENTTKTIPENSDDKLYYIFWFTNLSNILQVCSSISFHDCNDVEIWKYQNKYYLIFESAYNVAENLSFIIGEYNGENESSDLTIACIEEHGECIVKNVKKMQKAFT